MNFSLLQLQTVILPWSKHIASACAMMEVCFEEECKAYSSWPV